MVLCGHREYPRLSDQKQKFIVSNQSHEHPIRLKTASKLSIITTCAVKKWLVIKARVSVIKVHFNQNFTFECCRPTTSGDYVEKMK